MKVGIPGTPLVGHIRITDLDGRRELYATCPCKAEHGTCIKTRTVNPGRRKGKGRPLGFLAAWLRGAKQAGIETKTDHMRFEPSLAQRREARMALAEKPSAARYFAFERPKGAGEASEPEEFLA